MANGTDNSEAYVEGSPEKIEKELPAGTTFGRFVHRHTLLHQNYGELNFFLLPAYVLSRYFKVYHFCLH